MYQVGCSTFSTTLVSCDCSKCSIYRSEAGCLEGYCCLARPLRKEQTGAADACRRHQCRLLSIYKSMKLFKGLTLHPASPSSTLHHTFTTDLTLVSCGCSKCSIYRSEAGCLEGVWHALYAKSKLVPLTPTSDISVGYLSVYKSMKTL